MEFVDYDFNYYKRTMQGLYYSYYLKRIIITAVALFVTVVYTVLVPSSLWLNVLLIALFGGLLFFWIRQRMQFEALYTAFLQKNQAEAKIEKLEEDEFTYNVLIGNDEKVRINKKGSRNLPSQNRELTLLVGFNKQLFAKQPFQVVYFNMLDLTYDSKYRLRMNKVSRVPRFLRAFTWRNLKSSSTNLVSFVITNIFALFILVRLISYVIDIVRKMLSM